MTEHPPLDTEYPVDEKRTLESLAAENRALRERITELEVRLAEFRDEIGEIKRQNRTRNDGMRMGAAEADDGTPGLVTSGGQPTKVIGRLSDTDAIGVLGEATGGGGASRGVLGQTQSGDPGATGVRGEATAESGETYGVHGKTNGDETLGAAGVFADARNTAATALLARANGGTGDGVNASASKDTYYGVLGRHTANSGNDAHGVVAVNSSSDASALLANGSGGGAIEALGNITTTGNISQSDSTEQKTAGPIAKGYINSDGSIANAVNVDSVSYNSSNTWYEIELTGESYDFDGYATIVTSDSGNAASTGGGGSSGEALIVYCYDDTGSRVQDSFQFVTFALPSGTVTTSTDSANPSRVDELRQE